jgi:anti-anti-sigma regulatory factor
LNDVPFNVSKNEKTGVTTVALGAYLGVGQAEELGRAFETVLTEERPLVIVEMENVSFLCSSVIGKLISAVGKAREKSGVVVLSDIPPKICAVLGYLDVLDYIDYAADRREAEAKVLALVDSTGTGVIKDVDAAMSEAIALSKEGEVVAAASLLKRILGLEPENVNALIWYADVKEKTGQIDYARELFKRAKEVVPPSNGLPEYINTRLKRLDRRKTYDDETAEEAARVLGAADVDFVPWGSPFFSRERFLTGGQSSFFSSFRPALEKTDGREKDFVTYGGYFLSVNGCGFVIDPGAGFVEHFSRYGGTIGDVDAVIVTRFSGSADANLTPVLDAAAAGGREGVKVYANRTAYRYYYTFLNDFGKTVVEAAMMNPGETFNVRGIEVTPVRVHFKERFGGKEALGLILKSDKFAVGYIGECNCLEMKDIDDWLPVRNGLFVLGLSANPSERPSLKDCLRFVSIVGPAATLCGGHAPIGYLEPFADTLARLAGAEVMVAYAGNAFDLERFTWVPIREVSG